MDQEKPDERARRLDEEGKCVLCGREEGNRKRGLCSAHYQIWRRMVKKAGPNEVDLANAKLIADGKLLPDQRFAADPFNDALLWVREKTGEYSKDEVEKIIASGSDSGEERTKSKRPTRRRNTNQ